MLQHDAGHGRVQLGRAVVALRNIARADRSRELFNRLPSSAGALGGHDAHALHQTAPHVRTQHDYRVGNEWQPSLVSVIICRGE